MDDGRVLLTFRIDQETARLIRDVIYAVGEHQAAGEPIPTLNREDSERLGAFLRDLDVQTGGVGRMT